MEYFFIPGRLKNLSWAELNSVCKCVLGSQYTLTNKGEYFVLKTSLENSFVENVFSKLGGFLKYGEILDSDIDVKSLVSKEKVVFGISSHSLKFQFKEIKFFSQKLKDEFTSVGKKVRFVLPKEEVFLSSVQVLKNNLIKDGFELVILDNQMGKTLGVQDLENFSLRDYGKPFVDNQMGVLPIKLARMMINLAEIKQSGALWDPFCGSGNILLEGLDLGYNVFGSDIDSKGLEGAEKNMRWAINHFKYKVEGKTFYLDVLNPTPSKLDVVSKAGIDGIVCEPYMGKPQRRLLGLNEAHSLVKQHYSLVQNLFMILKTLYLEKKIRLVIIFPEYRTKNGWISIEKNKLNFKNTKLIEKDLHWSRENSIIKRLIFVFEYKPK